MSPSLCERPLQKKQSEGTKVRADEASGPCADGRAACGPWRYCPPTSSLHRHPHRWTVPTLGTAGPRRPQVERHWPLRLDTRPRLPPGYAPEGPRADQWALEHLCGETQPCVRLSREDNAPAGCEASLKLRVPQDRWEVIRRARPWPPNTGFMLGPSATPPPGAPSSRQQALLSACPSVEGRLPKRGGLCCFQLP